MKLDHEEEPPLTEPYLSKQKKLMVSRPEAHGALCWWGTAVGMCSHLSVCPSVSPLLSTRPRSWSTTT